MISESISTSSGATSDKSWPPLVADVVFWSTAGSAVAVLCEPLGRWWGVPSTALLGGGLLFVVGGAGMWLWLRRARPVSRHLLQGFGVANSMLAPALWVMALCHWLPVTGAGNWALASAGDVALLLGAWQLIASRRAGR